MLEDITLLFHSDLSNEYTQEQIDQKTIDFKGKSPEIWFKTLGNLWQFSGVEDYKIKTQHLVRELFSKCYDDIALFNVDESTYRFVFEKSIEILVKYSDVNPDLLAVIGFLYREGRYGLNDSKKTIEYTIESHEKGSEEGVMAYAFHLYHGFGIEKNTEKGFDLLDTYLSKHKSDGCQAVKGGLLAVENPELAYLIFEQIIVNPDSKWASYAYFMLAELNMEKDIDKAIMYYQKSIDLNQTALPFLSLGKLYLYGLNKITPDVDKGIQLLHQAFEMGNSQAGLILGYYFVYNAENIDLEQGAKLIQKAATFPNEYAKYEYACLCLYNDRFSSAQKLEAIALLESIIDEYPHALIELAYNYASGDVLAKDLQKSIELIDEALSKKYDRAATFASDCFERGQLSADGAPDYERSLHYLLKGAEFDNQQCIEKLGQYYRMGIGTEPNYEVAISYMEKGIALFQSSFAIIELAMCYEAGLGVEEDLSKAFELYQKAAEQNDAYAHFQIGNYYQNGVFTDGEPNYEMAFEQYEISFEMGYHYAGYSLGLYFLNGYGVEQNIEKGLELLHEQLEAQNVKAAVDIALYYENMETVDWEQVHHYMNIAVNEKYGFALCKLGDYYYHGSGVAEDVDKAKKYYLEAIENDYPYANMIVGNIELWTEASDSDSDNAFAYYQAAEEYQVINQGLGICYKYGIGTEQNEELSLEKLQIAAQNNYCIAQYELGLSYVNGVGTKPNAEKALEWFERAIEYDHINSYYEAGVLLLEGENVTQNLAKAKEYLEYAAQNDSADAQFVLANMYLIGNGVEENSDYAIELFNKAADAGHEEASKIVGR